MYRRKPTRHRCSLRRWKTGAPLPHWCGHGQEFILLPDDDVARGPVVRFSRTSGPLGGWILFTNARLRTTGEAEPELKRHDFGALQLAPRSFDLWGSDPKVHCPGDRRVLSSTPFLCLFLREVTGADRVDAGLSAVWRGAPRPCALRLHTTRVCTAERSILRIQLHPQGVGDTGGEVEEANDADSVDDCLVTPTGTAEGFNVGVLAVPLLRRNLPCEVQ